MVNPGTLPRCEFVQVLLSMTIQKKDVSEIAYNCFYVTAE
jgi:hypothetical protein